MVVSGFLDSNPGPSRLLKVSDHLRDYLRLAGTRNARRWRTITEGRIVRQLGDLQHPNHLEMMIQALSILELDVIVHRGGIF